MFRAQGDSNHRTKNYRPKAGAAGSSRDSAETSLTIGELVRHLLRDDLWKKREQFGEEPMGWGPKAVGVS